MRAIRARIETALADVGLGARVGHEIEFVLVDPGGGQVRTFKVQNDAARANLSRVKPGDNLTAISVDVAAIGLTRK